MHTTGGLACPGAIGQQRTDGAEETLDIISTPNNENSHSQVSNLAAIRHHTHVYFYFFDWVQQVIKDILVCYFRFE